MQAVILAGGMGSRLSEETALRPKPMIEIGGRPLLWHIMKSLTVSGITDFIVCLGYRGYVIKEYFANYFLHTCDVTFDIATNRVEVHESSAEPWRVTLVDTGETSMTGGRLARVERYLEGGPFLFTYGDVLSDIDVPSLAAFHESAGTRATITAVRPPGRYGALVTDGDRVTSFKEKPAGDGNSISGGYFVVRPDVVDLIEGDETVWEAGPLETLARDGELSAFAHDGFWHAMDTLRDKVHLESLWASGKAPWKTW
jgi:glucose-1-phosphate cytidylyltransferase